MKMPKVFLLFAITGCYLLLFSSCNSGNENEDSDKENSIEELIEKNLGETMSFEEMPDTMQVAHMVRVWNGSHNIKFLDNLADLYASNIFFYGEERSSYDAIQVKRKVFNAYPEYFQRIIGGIRVKKLNTAEYRAEFTKYISVGKITAPVPAYLIFKKSDDNKWIIVAESDPETDIKTKELKDSMQMLMNMYTPSSTEIKGNFSGKGSETIYIFPPDDDNCTDCTTSLFFSNELLPPIDIKGTKSAQLFNEGDLDGDGIEEFSSLTRINQEGQMTIYSFKRGSWKILKQFKVNYEQLRDDIEARKSAVQLAGPGYIYIQEWKGDTTHQEKVNIWEY